MKITVYTVLFGYHYESDSIQGVFDTYNEAYESIKPEIESNESFSKNINIEGVSRFRSQNSSFEIQKWEVDIKCK